MSKRTVQASTGASANEKSVSLVAREPLTPAERQREMAEYLGEMILELRNLARSVKLYTVMVPLEYAYYEAFSVANRIEVPEDELERIKRLSQASADNHDNSDA
ncbi:MAG: hypothetical protein ACKOED_05360 [Aestuariivirga sp.]|uniref:hypothetical protein n=1 Tax=Aestuariivirga sp. TaxID=2650926 RepID=UPI0038D23AC6